MRTLPARLLAAACLALPMTACPPGVPILPKVGPEEVRLLDPDLGQFPEPGYEHIGPVDAVRPAGTPAGDLFVALRAVGARRGADAVILQRVREDVLAAAPTEPAEPVVIAEGLAIFWPRR